MLSFRRRLGLVHLSLILAVLAVAGLAAYWSLSRAVHGQLDAALLALAETEAGMLADGRSGPVRIHEAVAVSSAPLSFTRIDRLVQIVDARGELLARSANLGAARLPAHPDTLARVAQGESVFETLRGFSDEPTRMVTVPVRTGQSLRAVQVAGSLDDVHNTLRAAAGLFVVMGGVLLVTVGAAGGLMTGRVFRAIDEVVAKAHRIGEHDMSQRLPHPGTADEIGRLVDTLNDMLARIERSVDVQRRFTADASHELRSPLSRLRTELELALRRPRDPEVYVETLRSGLEEVERLTLLVEELLALARLDAGQERGRAERVLLNTLADEATRRMEPIARARDVALEVEAAGPVRAQAAASSIGLVLDNLLDNAIKFSPPGGRVTLSLIQAPSQVVLRVRDRGPGIPADELERVFERFYRGPSARPGSTPGMGLGLALSRAIALANAGQLAAANAPGGGAVFELRLPALDTAAS
ncbi:MAG: ATP-binding protein [Pseudomonadota bacterium]|nr:ATP-binding protein [Pseudomonadota bacterium]